MLKTIKLIQGLRPRVLAYPKGLLFSQVKKSLEKQRAELSWDTIKVISGEKEVNIKGALA